MSSSTTQQDLEALLKKSVEQGKVPNAVVYATNADGSFHYEFATGWHDYDTKTRPITKDAIFMLASQTKLLTSIAALQAVEQGFLGLDEDISNHIPEFSKNGIITGLDDEGKPIIAPKTQPLTLRHLLTHSAGATYQPHPLIGKHQKARGINISQQLHAPTILSRFDTALLYEPGSSWSYSPALDWTGLLLQRLTNLDLEAWMQKNLFAPLSLSNITFWPPSHALIPHLMTRSPTTTNALTRDQTSTLNTNSTECFGGHGAYANLKSYLKVQQSLLANDGKLLKPATVDAMFSPQLGEQSAEAFEVFVRAFGEWLPGSLNPECGLQYGLGGALQSGRDWEEVGRRRGTMMWSGYYNPVWYIDRESDLAWTFGTNLLPPGDPACKALQAETEKALYKMLKEWKEGA